MKAFKVFFYILIGLAILYYLSVTVAAPIRIINGLNNIATSDSVFMKRSREIATFSKLRPLVIEKAHIEAQISLANLDSIGLVINFKDSTASLMLKGVEIHTSKIIRYKKDKIFDGIESPAYRKLFSKPLRNIDDYSTIVKEPIVTKKAPKDTIEAMKMAVLPDSIPLDPAYVSFTLEYGFKLILVQDKWVSEDEKKVEKKYKYDLNRQIIGDNISGIFNLKQPYYTPTVIIELDGREVRSIYRALPMKASFVMMF